jgi:uncharacterized protein (DUF433 family)
MAGAALLALDRITHEPGKMGGQPCIRGMRITVASIVEQIADGATPQELLADYPDLEMDDIRQALKYAAAMTREEVVPA